MYERILGSLCIVPFRSPWYRTRQMLLFNLYSRVRIYSRWHWFIAFLGIYRFYRSLIVNPILLESGRGAMQEKVWIGWEVSEAIGMCLDSLSSCLLADIAFVGWWSHVLFEEGFSLLKLLQQSTLQKNKKTRIFCQGFGNWISACHNMMKPNERALKP